MPKRSACDLTFVLRTDFRKMALHDLTGTDATNQASNVKLLVDEFLTALKDLTHAAISKTATFGCEYLSILTLNLIVEGVTEALSPG